MMNVRLISKSLLSVLILIHLISCSNDIVSDVYETNSNSDTKMNLNTEEGISELSELDIPEDLDYGGDVFTVEAIDQRGTPLQPINNPFSLEETTGDILNDIVFNAKNWVEERLNIKLEQQFSANAWDYGRLRKHAIAGDDSIDAFSYIDRFGVYQAEGGYVVPYGNIPNINLENPWWYSEINDLISIGDKLCYAVGAMNLDVVSRMTTLIYNKRIHSNLQLENPYDLIAKGKWTTDKMYEMMAAATDDLNGDNQMTSDDLYGAVYEWGVWYQNFSLLSGYHMVKKDSQDLPYMDVSGNDALVSVWQKLLSYSSGGDAFVVDRLGATKKYDAANTYVEALYMFMDGHSLFTSAMNLGDIAYLRDMPDDFGILPFPHMEEEVPGTPYGGLNQAVGEPLFVPSSNSDLSRTGYVFETLCYRYYTDVVDPYLEDVAYVKQTRDEESEKMLKMMKSNLQVDWANAYWYEDVVEWWMQVFKSGKNTFISSYEAREAKAEAALKKTIKIFEDFD